MRNYRLKRRRGEVGESYSSSLRFICRQARTATLFPVIRRLLFIVLILVSFAWAYFLRTFSAYLEIDVRRESNHESAMDSNDRYLRGFTDHKAFGIDYLSQSDDSKNKTFQKSFRNLADCTPLSPEDIQFTLVTQLSDDRLWMLEHHCRRWGSQNPMSIVVYTTRKESEILEMIHAMGCTNISPFRPDLRESDRSVVQVFNSSMYPPHEYPVNILRNKALTAIRSSHAMYVDIDFWPSVNLYDSLHHPYVLEALSMEPKLGIIIPAFQLHQQCEPNTECRMNNLRKMPQTSQEMKALIDSHHGSRFDPTNGDGHGSTNYAFWSRIVTDGLGMQQGPLLDIPCIKSIRYEPYMAFRVCEVLPPFQEVFTGYGKNKMTWMMQLRRIGYRFQQLGVAGEFVVHYPHLDSESRLEWNKSPPNLNQVIIGKGKQKRMKLPRDMKGVQWLDFKRGQVDALFVEFRNWLEKNVPDTSQVPMCEDAKDRDEKLWIHK